MKKEIKIDGMSCKHCKMAVEKALGQIPNIDSIEVNLEEKKAMITYQEKIDEQVIKKIIAELGYEVR